MIQSLKILGSKDHSLSSCHTYSVLCALPSVLSPLCCAIAGLYDNVFDEEIAQIVVDSLRSRRHASARSGAGDAPPSPGTQALADRLRDQALRTPLSTADAEAVALSIARTAHSYAQKTHQKTPWSVSACETGMPWARFFVKGGGKMDDVTVVVGFVVEDQL